MKLSEPRLWLSLLTIALVLLVALRDVRDKTSPGPLAPSHAARPELASPDGCVLCHGEGAVGAEEACLECHAPILAQLQDGAGLHGGVTAIAEASCATCHLDHHGDEVPLAGELAFTHAGLDGPEGFAHGHVAFELVGQHADLACVECHANAEAILLAEGEGRFVGASQACATCHEDPHEGDYTQDCARCHGQEAPFEDVAGFVHTDDLPLEGVHAALECAACHEPGTERDVARSILNTGATPRDCASCHESPHASPFLAAIGDRIDALPGASCVHCHSTAEGDFAAGELERALHAATGVPLDAPHQDVTCAECHVESTLNAPAPWEARFPGRAADNCGACHEDSHGGQFDTGTFVGVTCATCHAGEAFVPSSFGAELHARTAFALDGQHLAAECVACHAEPVPPEALLVFAVAPSECSACHEDAHEGRLQGARAAEGCDACHGTSAFADVVREEFDHRASTFFDLTGAHGRAECESCHVPLTGGLEGVRAFGRIDAAAAAGAERCDVCHEDVHAGAFDVPRAGAERGCARCHTTGGFRDPSRGRFEHGDWTPFVLEGAHDAVACSSCHALGEAVDGRELGRFLAAPGGARACADCHDDPHGGRFTEALGDLLVGDSELGDVPAGDAVTGEPAPRAVDCAHCHVADGFDLEVRESFEHGRFTGFALDAAHDALDCTACHAPAPAGAELALGATLGARCDDCHQDPHAGQFLREDGMDCARCHSAEASFLELRFDHQRDSRFELDERHAELDCTACHQPWPLADGTEVVRYRPLGTTCVECHGSELGGEER